MSPYLSNARLGRYAFHSEPVAASRIAAAVRRTPTGLWKTPRGAGNRPDHSWTSSSLILSASEDGTTLSASRKAPRAARVPTSAAYNGGHVGQASR